MSLTMEEYPNDLVLHARVTCDEPITDAVFADLEQGLDALKDQIDTGDATYVAISAHIVGTRPSQYYENRIPESTSDTFVPYANFSPAFWDAVLKDQSTRELTVNFLDKIEKFSRYATREEGGIWYLCESDEVLFCQPILFYLAMQDIQFVTNYTRMLSCWRTEESSIWCAEDIAELLERYGWQAETKALLESYLMNSGPHGEDFEEYFGNIG